MSENTIVIRLTDIDPYIIRSPINPLAPGYTTGPRTIGHYQIQYVYKGAGNAEINGQQYEVCKGDLCYWGPGIRHMITSSERDPLTILGAQFHLVYDLKGTELAFSDFAGFPHCLKLHSPGKAEMLLLEMVQEFAAQKLFFQETINALCKSFLLLAARQVSVNKNNRGAKSMLSDCILKFIHDHYHKPLTNRDVAAYFNFHPAYINKLVNASTGMSLHKYIMNVRLNLAVELLSTTDI